MTVRLCVILLSIIFFVGTSVARAEMSSTNFRIPYSVLSSAGGYQDSTNFQTEETLGQPAPLMEDEFVPSSTNYKNHPGFWYLIAGAPGCLGDYDLDKDVDGSDLFDHILDAAGVSIAAFAENFGKVNCE